jgi:hypothetical protein
MREMRFAEFRDGKWQETDDSGYGLYVIKNERGIIYVGISNSGVWDRWFASNRSHIPSNIYSQRYAVTDVGFAIMDRRPQSDDSMSERNVSLWWPHTGR